MIDEKQKDAPVEADAKKDASRLDEIAERQIVLGKIKTDEEARLAAEIEKLRG